MLEFWIPMGLLFLAATITTIVTRRKRDRCLRFFNKEPVMIQMKSGIWFWGRLVVYPKTMELIFENPQPDKGGIIKSSYILYSSEIEEIHKILQLPPSKGTQGYKRWNKEIKRIANPSIFRRIRRWFWNLFNTFRDAVSQSFSMVLGSLKSRSIIGKIAGADKRANEIGNTLLGTIPNAYEPILEKYLSKRVIVEMVEEGNVLEFSGFLQEYSGRYLLLRQVSIHPSVDIGTPLPDYFDVIFPRSQALVRHRLD